MKKYGKIRISNGDIGVGEGHKMMSAGVYKMNSNWFGKGKHKSTLAKQTIPNAHGEKGRYT